MGKFGEAWAPKEHPGVTREDHMKKMYSIGSIDSKVLYCNPVITGVSSFIIWSFVIWAMVQKSDAAAGVKDAQAWVTEVWNWFYMISQNVWIVALVYLLIRHFNLKFGKEDDEIEFSDATYFAMLFSCGVATGLWYFTAEGMWHYEGYGNPRWTDKMMFNDNTKAEHALMILFFHWGLHGWIPYSMVGALIALLTYRRGFPMSMRFTLYPLIGEMVYGVIGDAVEVLSILCTIFGVCTSLGLGAAQINKGLVRLDKGTYRGASGEGYFGIAEDKTVQCVIIASITACATCSVVAGLKAGIAILSQIAFALSLVILFAVLLMDETWYILNAVSSAFGYYLWYLPKVAFHTDAWEELGHQMQGRGGAPDMRGGGGHTNTLSSWMNGWTIFYWGWWISWGPFVGTFLARISKGRTLGNFILATLILPSCWSFFFMGTFGAAQIRITNQAKSAGLTGAKGLVYGSMANPKTIGYFDTTKCKCKAGYGSGGCTLDKTAVDPVTKLSCAVWNPVYPGTVKLYSLATEDVLFEHLQYYGDETWGCFITVIAMAAIVLYFVTSSDSASYVVDIMAANGAEEPPLTQKIFWATTEGVAAIALVASADPADPKAALEAVKALPIVLGLPYTFLLFWMCQSLLIVAAEESGKIPVVRKNFVVFLLNIEPMTAVSFIAPFVPLGTISEKVWKGNRIVYTVLWGFVWLWCISFCIAGAGDPAFAYVGCSTYFVMGLGVAFLRAGQRTMLGITGDMVSDVLVGCFFFPFGIGQMFSEDFTDLAPPKRSVAENEKLAQPIGNKTEGAPVEFGEGVPDPESI